MPPLLSLSEVRAQALDYAEHLRDRDGLYGAYRMAPRRRCDLYSSCDIAIMRAIMGEDLPNTLHRTQRAEWCEHINSFANRDGSYRDTHGHAALHANGMVVGALGVLGGRQPAPVALYEDFKRPGHLDAWLSGIAWSQAWSASHLIWGGLHCFSLSARATPEWWDAAFAWLDRNLDSTTGWWRRGVPHEDRHQGLGGAVHVFPIYEHHGRAFPFPERVIDSVLAMQLSEGNWLHRPGHPESFHVMHYLELDALYALVYMGRIAPRYRRNEVQASLLRFGNLAAGYFRQHSHRLFSLHPHAVLGAIGGFGLLRQALPEEFPDDASWTDIFSDIRLYQTAQVEQLPTAES